LDGNIVDELYNSRLGKVALVRGQGVREDIALLVPAHYSDLCRVVDARSAHDMIKRSLVEFPVDAHELEPPVFAHDAAQPVRDLELALSV